MIKNPSILLPSNALQLLLGDRLVVRQTFTHAAQLEKLWFSDTVCSLFPDTPKHTPGLKNLK